MAYLGYVTHGFHKLLDIPSGIDIVIHSGDCSNSRDPFNNESEVRRFIDWYKDLPIKNKVYVAGNHDTSIENKLVTKEDFKKAGITYLENEYATVCGLKIFGSPHTPRFGNWAFMKERNKLERFWRKAMNEDCDIVVTHGPPKGALDKSYDREGRMEHCGDKSLFNRIREIEPGLSLFGHIHNTEDIINAGVLKFSVGETLYSNGSVVTDGKFGKLTSNGNVIERSENLWQKLKRYIHQL